MDRIETNMRKFRGVARTMGRLIKIWRDIQLYGGSRNHYAQNIAWKQSFQEIQENVPKCLFTPNNSFKKFWSIVIVLLLLWTASIMPYRVCFQDETPLEWLIFDSIIDGLFFLDILVNFNSAILDQQGKLIVNRKIIIKTYLKGWFFIDMIACIPFQYISDQDEQSSYNKLLRLMRIPRLYRLLRIFRLFKMVRLFRSQAFINKLINMLRMTTGILRMIRFGFTVLLMIHIVGCFWYFLAKIQEFHYDTWVVRHGLLDKSHGQIYLASIYWVIQTLTTVGFGDILAVTPSQRIFALILMGVGVGFYSYTISNLSTIMATLDTRTSNLKTRLAALNEFSKATKLPDDLKKKIRNYITHNHQENIYSWFDKDALLKELPASLCREISIHMHKKIVGKIAFFQDKDPQFISHVVPKLKNQTAPYGQFLYKQGDHASQMYFLIKGKISLKAENNIIFKTYNQGAYFGQVELLDNRPRDSSVQVASKTANLLVLGKRDFSSILQEFPIVAREVRETAKLREQKNKEAQQHALQLSNPRKGWGRMKPRVQVEAAPKTESLESKNEQKLLQEELLSGILQRNTTVTPITPTFTTTPTVSSIVFSPSDTHITNQKVTMQSLQKEDFQTGHYSPDLSECESREEQTEIDLKEILEDLNFREEEAEATMNQTRQILSEIEQAHIQINQKLVAVISKLTSENPE